MKRGKRQSGMVLLLAMVVGAGGGSGLAALPGSGGYAATDAAPAAGASVIDRTIAVVNGHLITLSDLDEEMRFEALDDARALTELGEPERRAAFERLVQNAILLDQTQGIFPAADSDVNARIAALRAAWHMENDDAGWAATLERYGISPQELHELIANQIDTLRFMELRVRPLVRVSRQEVEDYYNGTLAPKVRALGQTPEPLDRLRSEIRDLLEEQKMNVEMEKWLDTQRSQARVQVLWDGVR
jgi:hypothetical protein